MRRSLVLGTLTLLAGCAPRPVVAHLEGPFPERLSDWRLFVGRPAALVTNQRVIPYDVSVPLFSDHAYKHRTVWLPEGTAAEYRDNGVFEFPVGTVFSKTFYYERGGAPAEVRSESNDARTGGLVGTPETRVLVETRLLVHARAGWVALPYVWDEAQVDAVLQVAGDERRLTWRRPKGAAEAFVYLVPNTDQCAGCHVRIQGHERRLRPLGPTARQLNKAYGGGPVSQLVSWQKQGLLRGAPAEAPEWSRPGQAAEASRARAYLDVQCAHCHAPDGPAASSGLTLGFDAPESVALGVCKRPVATGRGSGGLDYDVVPGHPDASILVHRLASREPDVMMPELGRNLRDERGLALVRAWIEALPGDCS